MKLLLLQNIEHIFTGAYVVSTSTVLYWLWYLCIIYMFLSIFIYNESNYNQLFKNIFGLLRVICLVYPTVLRICMYLVWCQW